MATSMNHHYTTEMKPKTSKHIMERKRRARINDSLLQLKSLVFPTVRKEIARHPKLEKADILEMTVRHIQELQRPTSGSSANNVSQFHAGFSECLSEVSQFLSNCENIELDTRLRILNHLADKCSTMPEPASPESRLTASSPVQQSHQQQPMSSPMHHRRSPVHHRHSPYGYQMESRRQVSPVAQSHTELRVPPVHNTQDNLVVVIPAAEAYPTHTVFANRVSPSADMYPTPPQSPVDNAYTTTTTQYSGVPVHQMQHHFAATESALAAQQTRVQSPISLPARQPVQIQEPVWRPW